MAEEWGNVTRVSSEVGEMFCKAVYVYPGTVIPWYSGAVELDRLATVSRTLSVCFSPTMNPPPLCDKH